LGLATALTNLGAVLELAALGAIVPLLHCRGNTHIKYCGSGQREAKNSSCTEIIITVVLQVRCCRIGCTASGLSDNIHSRCWQLETSYGDYANTDSIQNDVGKFRFGGREQRTAMGDIKRGSRG
jgi:hypothetical protein